MEELAKQLVRYGLPLVFLNVLCEQAGLPIPATPILVMSGALAATGQMSASLVLLMAVTASLLADSVWFALGRRHGRRILKQLCRVSLSPDSCVRQTEGLFHRYGLYSIAVAKFVPGFSTVAPPLAGAMGVRWLPFAMASTAAALLWTGASLAVGWIFHDALEELAEWLESLGFGALLIIGALLGGFIAFKLWQRHRFHRSLRIARISPADLRVLLTTPKGVMIFDVRSDSGRSGDPRRIPGALVLHADDPGALDTKLADLPREHDIVLYCT
jgi:membrane protein DedA with SNARE-associated domain